jgi:hypothetical protein
VDSAVAEHAAAERKKLADKLKGVGKKNPYDDFDFGGLGDMFGDDFFRKKPN